jgi:RNA polymerase-associated protein RTF1
MDMETDSEGEEDGQISKYEEEEEKDRKRFGKPEPDDELITLEDLNQCRLTRTQLVKHCMAPWFEDYVKGMFYFVTPLISLCSCTQRSVGALSYWPREWPTRISHMRVNQCVAFPTLVLVLSFKTSKDLGVNLTKPYMVDDKMVNHQLELRHGKSLKIFLMDKVSNSEFQPVGSPFYRLRPVSECTLERV